MCDRILVILAGGKSSRMGRDKTFLPYKNTTFLEHLLQNAGLYFSEIYISAGSGEHADRIRKFLEESPCGSVIPSDHIIPDHYDRIGPMGGILSVFESVGCESFVLLAVDIPDADMHVLAALSDLAGAHGEAALMLQLSGPGRMEACAAVYHRDAYRLMKRSFEQGEYSLRKALGPEQIRCIDVPLLQKYLPGICEEDLKRAFRNMNTPQDYACHSDEWCGSRKARGED